MIPVNASAPDAGLRLAIRRAGYTPVGIQVRRSAAEFLPISEWVGGKNRVLAWSLPIPTGGTRHFLGSAL
jgi:hypothetical protein